MANLITKKQKRIIKIDYFIRLFSVLLLAFSLLGVFLLTYIISYYFSINKNDINVVEQFDPIVFSENEESIGTSVLQIANQISDQLKTVELYNPGNFAPSIYFTKIIESKNDSIHLTSLSFSLVKKGEVQLFASGISDDREGLVVFIEDLKLKGGFNSVQSPVSDFAKDSDITFTLNIVSKI